jgi:hypothetical protein
MGWGGRTLQKIAGDTFLLEKFRPTETYAWASFHVKNSQTSHLSHLARRTTVLTVSHTAFHIS